MGYEGAENDDLDNEMLPYTSIWQDMPDSILLHVFSFLEVQGLGKVAQTCKVRTELSLH